MGCNSVSSFAANLISVHSLKRVRKLLHKHKCHGIKQCINHTLQDPKERDDKKRPEKRECLLRLSIHIQQRSYCKHYISTIILTYTKFDNIPPYKTTIDANQNKRKEDNRGPTIPFRWVEKKRRQNNVKSKSIKITKLDNFMELVRNGKRMIS